MAPKAKRSVAQRIYIPRIALHDQSILYPLAIARDEYTRLGWMDFCSRRTSTWRIGTEPSVLCGSETNVCFILEGTARRGRVPCLDLILSYGYRVLYSVLY